MFGLDIPSVVAAREGWLNEACMIVMQAAIPLALKTAQFCQKSTIFLAGTFVLFMVIMVIGKD